MNINNDIIIHHISKYTDIRTTYNLLNSSSHLRNHLGDILNIDYDKSYYRDPGHTIVPRNRRILSICIINRRNKHFNLDEFHLLEILELKVYDSISAYPINLNYSTIRTLNIDFHPHTIHYLDLNALVLHDNLETLNIYTKGKLDTYYPDMRTNDNKYKLPSNLKSLSITKCKMNIHQNIDDLLLPLRDKLEYLKLHPYFEYMCYDLNDYVTHSITNHNKLKVMSLKHYTNLVIDNLPELEELTINVKKSMSITNVPSLKRLTIIYKHNISFYFDDTASIEELTFINHNPNVERFYNTSMYKICKRLKYVRLIRMKYPSDTMKRLELPNDIDINIIE